MIDIVYVVDFIAQYARDTMYMAVTRIKKVQCALNKLNIQNIDFLGVVCFWGSKNYDYTKKCNVHWTN